MGSWSVDILGGDGPYDVRGELIDIFAGDDEDGGHFWYEQFSKTKYRDLLNKHMNAVVRRAKELVGDYDNEAGLVLGYIILELGANMSGRTRAFILSCARSDSWAREDDERKTVINDFIAKVKAYVPGKAVKMEHKGLLDTICGAISKGKTGLINV